jgi:hypothetical protein
MEWNILSNINHHAKGMRVFRSVFVHLIPCVALVAYAQAEEARALVWDTDKITSTPKPGEATTSYTFAFKNASNSEIAIHSAEAACGCTVAKLPEQPWKIIPGAAGEIKVTMDLGGKAGRISKRITVHTSAGDQFLVASVDLPPPVSGVGHMGAERIAHIELARTDRQSIFKADCRSCHVDQGTGKLGHELYLADCAICHDAPERAAMVPDLHVPKGPRGLSYWHRWIEHGHPGSLMPAFAQSKGGPLSQEQINSLVSYLVKDFPQEARGAGVSTPIAVPPLPPGSRK